MRCKSDSKSLLYAFHAPEGKSLFDTIVEDCTKLIKHYEDVLIEFVPRSASGP